MNEIPTGALADALGRHDERTLGEFEREYAAQLTEQSFAGYMSELIARKGLKKSEVIRDSEIHITYAYQILNGLKAPGRDKVICLCIGAGCTLKETQRALALAKLGSLYARRLRDAVIILALNQGIHKAMVVNQMLAAMNQELLGSE
jgi:hypothetical protein